MFGLIVKDYFMKKIDYESKSIAITLRETTSSKMINGLNH